MFLLNLLNAFGIFINENSSGSAAVDSINALTTFSRSKISKPKKCKKKFNDFYDSDIFNCSDNSPCTNTNPTVFLHSLFGNCGVFNFKGIIKGSQKVKFEMFIGENLQQNVTSWNPILLVPQNCYSIGSEFIFQVNFCPKVGAWYNLILHFAIPSLDVYSAPFEYLGNGLFAPVGI